MMCWQLIERVRVNALAGVCIFLCVGCLVGPMSAQDSTQASKSEMSAELTRAREKAKTAKRKYKTVKRLGSLGSASQKDVRDAELFKRLAILELSDLVSPDLKDQNALMRATLVFNYRTAELKVTRSLFERGSASNLQFQRAKTAREVAQSQLKAAQSNSEAQRKIQIIKGASSKLAIG